MLKLINREFFYRRKNLIKQIIDAKNIYIYVKKDNFSKNPENYYIFKLKLRQFEMNLPFKITFLLKFKYIFLKKVLNAQNINIYNTLQ